MGDLNARTANKLDYILNDEIDQPNANPFYTYDDQNIPSRSNNDLSQNEYGQEIVDICIESGLRILNGRKLGDIEGKYTCHKYNGSSTIDYAITSHDIYPKILYFQVSDFIGSVSDHCKISLMINSSFNPKTFSKDTSLEYMPPKFKWNELSSQNFQQALTLPIIQSLIENFTVKNHIDSNSALNEFNEILYKGCEIAQIQKTKNKNTKKKKRSMPWFNYDCQKVKIELNKMSKKLGHEPSNSFLRGKYHVFRKKFKKMIKQTKRKYKQDICSQLENLHDNNPKTYWNLIEKLKNVDNSNKENDPPINPQEWLDYFNKLLSDSKIDQIKELETVQKLKDLEKIQTFTPLDFTLKPDEISSAIKTLKLNKAVGLDSVCNEMLKAGIDSLIAPITHLFNTIFSSSNFPHQWAEGYIIPLFKSGDNKDPAN